MPVLGDEQPVGIVGPEAAADVRERELRSAKAWRGMADRQLMIDAERIKADRERAERRAAELEAAVQPAVVPDY